MNYYIIKRSSDPEIIGVKNGFKQAEIKEDGFQNKCEFERLKDNLGSNHYWEVKDGVPSMNFDIEYVEMLKGAKITDFLQFGPVMMNCPFFVSDRVMKLMNDGNLANICYFPASVFSGKKYINKYYLMYISPLEDYVIDFSKSTYCVGDEWLGKKIVKFSSEEEKDEFSKKRILRAESLVLNGAFSRDIDIFCLKCSEIFVSERLYSALKEIKSTGLDFFPVLGEISFG